MTSRLTSFYPVLLSADVAAASEFYEKRLGFRRAFTSESYVHLQHAEHADVNLALLDANHDTVPPEQRTPTRGVIINIEVENVDSEYARLRDQAEIVLGLRDEPWGQRHFILRGPDEILIDIITPIPPSEQFAAGYEHGA
ncbi:MAG TPA: VOC family protein [Vicinamibacteria bacterium]|nr:VOC family protein [Vicinamibacteria bacterium]